ncbi:hypothetical protein F5X98DRAFT_234424 [Xylaria grammica]|nr:hypothetical protein F5X98DRAFT_234424 [Xylaria grammica]
MHLIYGTKIYLFSWHVSVGTSLPSCFFILLQLVLVSPIRIYLYLDITPSSHVLVVISSIYFDVSSLLVCLLWTLDQVISELHSIPDTAY